MPPPRLYLAGPEVFLPDALAVGAQKCTLCRAYGFEGVFPLDAALDFAGLEKPEQARRISASCERQMRSCAGLIANMTPFRGVSMDSGTAFEVGFMRALGRPVLGYTNVTADYGHRANTYRRASLLLPDADGPDVEVEDFGGAENLMIEAAILACGGAVVRHAAAPGQGMRDLFAFEECLRQAARLLLP